MLDFVGSLVSDDIAPLGIWTGEARGWFRVPCVFLNDQGLWLVARKTQLDSLWSSKTKHFCLKRWSGIETFLLMHLRAPGMLWNNLINNITSLSRDLYYNGCWKREPNSQDTYHQFSMNIYMQNLATTYNIWGCLHSPNEDKFDMY